MSKTDWTGWVAMVDPTTDSDSDLWCICPREFWEKNSHLPDSNLEVVPDGFTEVSDHTLEPDGNLPFDECRAQLEELGFTMLDDPKWWFSHGDWIDPMDFEYELPREFLDDEICEEW